MSSGWRAVARESSPRILALLVLFAACARGKKVPHWNLSPPRLPERMVDRGAVAYRAAAPPFVRGVTVGNPVAGSVRTVTLQP